MYMHQHTNFQLDPTRIAVLLVSMQTCIIPSTSVIFTDLILKAITQIPHNTGQQILGSLQTHKASLSTL